MKKTDVVFVHGWGLNSRIWSTYIDLVTAHISNITVHNLDLPGYGHLASQESSSDLSILAHSCLNRAPEKAIWVAWSLGGMVALKAAMSSRARILGLQLIGTSPRFVSGVDWPSGVDLDIFQRFSDELAANYQSALSTFLLLQAGGAKSSGDFAGARALAKQAHAAVCELPDPSPETLQKGIECLAVSDLRQDLSLAAALKGLPSQVVVGSRDRVANPEGGAYLAELISAELVGVDSGHAPFLTEPQQLLDKFKRLVDDVSAQVLIDDSL